jgi:hemerythrin
MSQGGDTERPAAPKLEWRRDFEIGIASVDYEHRELIALINRLIEALAGAGTKSEIEGHLGEIYAKVSAHFALEEQEMRKFRYDQLPDHKDDHEILLDEIREIMDAFEADAFDNPEIELAHRMEAWFTVHFQTKDARLHAFLKDRT